MAAAEAAVVVSNAARPLLVSMLRSQSYRELGAVQMLEQALHFVPPAAQDKLREQQQEEREHLAAALHLWQELTGTPKAALLEEAKARLNERPLPPMRTAMDLAMAQFVFDRAGYFQLRQYVGGSFAPYAAIAAGIVAEEEGHQDEGARAVVPLALNDPGAAQSAFAMWLRAALLSFGRPGSSGDSEAVALSLKHQASAAVMQEFVDSLRPTLMQAGLSLPLPESLQMELPSSLRL